MNHAAGLPTAAPTGKRPADEPERVTQRWAGGDLTSTPDRAHAYAADE